MVFNIFYILSFLLIISSCNNTDLDKITSSLTQSKAQLIAINKQPVANIKTYKNLIFKEGEDIIFSAKDSMDLDGSIDSYLWKIDGKDISNEIKLTYKFLHGTHILELEVTDNLGSVGIARRQVNIKKNYQKIKFNLARVEEIATLGGATKEITNLVIYDNHLFASSSNGNIYFWELATTELLNYKQIVAHKNYSINALLVTKDKIYSGSNDDSIKIFNKKTKLLEATLNVHTNTVTSLVSNDEIFISSSLDKSIGIYRVDNNKLITTLRGHKSPINDIKIIDNFIISTSSDKTIKIWDIDKNYKNVNTIDLIRYNADFMSIYDKNIITASKNGVILVWDIFRGVILKTLKTSSISDIKVYKDNIVVSRSNGSIIYYDIKNFFKRHVVTLEHKITSMTIQEGILAVALENFTIKLFGSKQDFEQR